MSENQVVKRIREHEYYPISISVDALLQDAADEIERLERELAIERAMRLGVQTQTIEEDWRQQQKPWTECDHT